MISLLTWYFDCYIVEKWHKNTYFWKMAWLLVKWTKDMMNLCTYYEKTCLIFQISRWIWEIWVLHPQVSKQNSVHPMQKFLKIAERPRWGHRAMGDQSRTGRNVSSMYLNQFCHLSSGRPSNRVFLHNGSSINNVTLFLIFFSSLSNLVAQVIHTAMPV